MGSGKSTAGIKLAERMNYDFIDLDEYIEKSAGKSIELIFSEEGESGFRKIENEALKELLIQPDAIIATGGGTPCYFDNMDLMNKTGKTVYLKIPEEVLVKRLMDKKGDRPLIKGKNEKELKEYVKKNLQEREGFYSGAQFTIHAEQLNVEKLLRLIF